MNIHKNQLIVFVISLAILVGLFVYGMSVRPVQAPQVPATTQVDTQSIVADVVYSCTDGKSIHAQFLSNPDTVAIDLSDGRSMMLPHALSADGARYANTDESFVFWNKGNTAFITENGTTTYTDCSTASQ